MRSQAQMQQQFAAMAEQAAAAAARAVAEQAEARPASSSGADVRLPRHLTFVSRRAHETQIER